MGNLCCPLQMKYIWRYKYTSSQRRGEENTFRCSKIISTCPWLYGGHNTRANKAQIRSHRIPICTYGWLKLLQCLAGYCRHVFSCMYSYIPLTDVSIWLHKDHGPTKVRAMVKTPISQVTNYQKSYPFKCFFFSFSFLQPPVYTSHFSLNWPRL